MSVCTLKNEKAGSELEFPIAPEKFSVESGFSFTSDGRLGKEHPLVAFQAGGGVVLRFKGYFDEDAHEKCSVAKVDTFLNSLYKVHSDTRSVSDVTFKMGKFKFKGFVQSYAYEPTRFDQDGAVKSVGVGFTLISKEVPEHGK